MNANILLISSLMMDMHKTEDEKHNFKEAIKEVIGKLKVVDGYIDKNLVLSEEDQSILKFFVAKTLIASPEIPTDSLIEYFENFVVVDLGDAEPLDVQVTALMRTSFALKRYALFMLITGAITQIEKASLEKEIDDQMNLFLASLSKMLETLDGSVSRFYLLNTAESLLRDQVGSVIQTLSGSKEVNDIFIDSPAPLLKNLFSDVLEHLKSSIFAASELLGVTEK